MKFGADLDALITRFTTNAESPLAIAVSGGSDSLGLLVLLSDWAKQSRRTLHVLTVDHRLRPEAADEAAYVYRISKNLGHMHSTLIWDAPKKAQNAARIARYRLLSDAARDIGAECIFLGHTLNDVVETALIRRSRGLRGSTIAGPTLASPPPVWPEGKDLTLLRPLTQSTRDEIQGELSSRGVKWVEDPSNTERANERVRVRQFLDRHPRLAKIALRTVSKLQRDRVASDQVIARSLEAVQVRPDGMIEADDSVINDTLLTLLARCAGGGDRDARAKAICGMRKRLIKPGLRQTIGGAWFQKTATGFLIGRDPAMASTKSFLDIFDGRYQRTETKSIPAPDGRSFLVRGTSPPDQNWREIISERLAHLALCYQTPLLKPVQR